MISDILFHLVDDLCRYLNDPLFDATYCGVTRERIVRLRDEAVSIGTILDAPPCEVEAAKQEPTTNDDRSKKQKFLEWMMSDKSAKRPPFFNQRDLLKRGWSKDLTAQLLGDPDWKQENPHYPDTAKMLCWRQDRVLAAEDTPAFQESRR